MRTCPNCHSKINENEYQCPHCGMVLYQLYCNYCNQPLDLRYGYCLSCKQPYSLPYKHSYQMKPLDSPIINRRADHTQYSLQKTSYEFQPASYQIDNPSSKETHVQKQKSTSRKTLVYSALILLAVAAISTGSVIIRNNSKSNDQFNAASNSVETGETTSQTQTQDVTTQSASPEQADVENTILGILNSTKVHSMFAPTIGNVVVAVFHNFDITYEAKQDDTKSYYVTIEGSYSPHPDYPNLSLSGKIVYVINIEKGSCILYSDPNSLNAIFLTYITY